MFILRTIDKYSKQTNLSLGDRYNLIRDGNPEHEELMEAFNGVGEFDRFISYYRNDGHYMSQPLIRGTEYYVMTPGGETFDNLTYLQKVVD